MKFYQITIISIGKELSFTLELRCWRQNNFDVINLAVETIIGNLT